VSSFLLFDRWIKEKEREKDEKMVIGFSLLESLKGMSH